MAAHRRDGVDLLYRVVEAALVHVVAREQAGRQDVDAPGGELVREQAVAGKDLQDAQAGQPR